MGLLDTQQAPQGGLMGGGMPQQQAQGLGMPPPSGGAMPPEMQNIISQIKTLPPDQKNQAIQKMIENIQQMPKSEQEKQQAIQQFTAAVQ